MNNAVLLLDTSNPNPNSHMNKVTIEKPLLIAKLTENRNLHKDAFDIAIEGYRDAAVKACSDLAVAVMEDVDTHLFIRLDKPEDHTKDYDNVLAMLRFHTEDTVTISATDFQHYIEDNWEWQERFQQMSKTYGTRS